jgi:hypothetical protein
LLGNRKKIAKFLMKTFTCRSTFLYGNGDGGDQGGRDVQRKRDYFYAKK